jgi:hypothetical protein
VALRSVKREGSLPSQQQQTTRTCPEPYESCPCPHTLFIKFNFHIVLPSTPLSSKWALSFSFSGSDNAHFSHLPIRSVSVTCHLIHIRPKFNKLQCCHLRRILHNHTCAILFTRTTRYTPQLRLALSRHLSPTAVFLHLFDIYLVKINCVVSLTNV